MRVRWVLCITSLCVLVASAFVLGMRVAPRVSPRHSVLYGSGMYGKAFFDAAYDRADGHAVSGVASILVAHHLLVANKIAEVFEDAASDDVRTVVLVSPNHFSRGIAVAQVSEGRWTTPYGVVSADAGAVEALIAADAVLHHEEIAYLREHGIFGLTPFVARSFPNARIVPIILSESLSAQDAWTLGEAIARTLPGAVLIASVDMTHYHDADYTAANDAKVLALLPHAGAAPFLEEGQGVAEEGRLDIDSNAALHVLFGFNAARGAGAWHLTHHGSSLEMGATTDWRENTSHILGYFTQAEE